MGGACHSGENRPRLQCDEAADCRSGEVCIIEHADEIDAECKSADDNGGGGDENVQVCKTDAECGAQGPCTVRVCTNGVKIKTCSPLEGCK